MTTPLSLRLLASAALAVAATSCAIGPHYQRPTMATPAQYGAGWKTAEPGAPDIASNWWTLFGDDTLNTLEGQVAVSNQNLKAAEAGYRVARAQARADVANIFPTFTANASAQKSGAGGGAPTVTRYQADIGGTWAVDLWGRLRQTASASRASAQASGADLAGATLSAQSELAADYIQLRAADEQKRLLDLTVAGDSDALRVAQNRYAAGVADRSDVASSQSQLATTQAEASAVGRQRENLEHAIAVLVGQAPAAFSIPATAWRLTVPDVPASVPSALLERRPDIAAAERRAAAANARIGVAETAFFPDLSLSGSYGGAASAVSALTSAPARVWTYGASAVETLLDFGRRGAEVKGAKAGFDQAAAQYRQTVLSAFQDVEDALTATRTLEEEQRYRDTASAAADQAETIANNQYRAGTIGHAELIVAQNAAHDARINALAAASDRMTNAVALIEAIGGGWRADQQAAKTGRP